MMIAGIHNTGNAHTDAFNKRRLTPAIMDQFINGISDASINIFWFDLFRGGCLGAG